ncbi:hypothetical protein JYQ62_03160 [Nostoc sp. UHCC 0702]|nr:hypothetical protein JYQ62_03160 [Nostoc sp. UHCC 0702]
MSEVTSMNYEIFHFYPSWRLIPLSSFHPTLPFEFSCGIRKLPKGGNCVLTGFWPGEAVLLVRAKIRKTLAQFFLEDSRRMLGVNCQLFQSLTYLVHN